MESGRDWTAIALARRLSGYVGRVVIDRTGLTGPFEIRLQWSSVLEAGPARGDSKTVEDGVSLFTALREQLGLKLDPGSERVPVLAVDEIHEPSEN